MNTLLKSRLALICLPAALAIAWFGGLIPGADDKALRGNHSGLGIDGAITVAFAESSPYRAPVPLAVARSIAQWRAGLTNNPERLDPFTFAAAVLAAKEAESPVSGGAETTLTLQGISTHGDRSCVVVNRQILSVGDSIGSWKVTGIDPTTVTFDGPRGRKTLKLDRSSATTTSKTSHARSESDRNLPTPSRPGPTGATP